MRWKHADLWIAALVAILGFAALVVSFPIVITVIVGIALVGAPGYLWSQVLLGSEISAMERAAVATGLALAVPIVGGLLLHVADLPLDRTSWLGLLGGVTLAGDLALVMRRRGGLRNPFGRPAERRTPARHLLAFGAAIAIAIGAVGLARVGVEDQHYPGFTQLWLTRQSVSATTADLGVGNYEGRAMRYRLVLLRNGHPIATWNIMLANDQVWHRSPPFIAGDAFVADLYRLPDLASPYRHVAIDGDG